MTDRRDLDFALDAATIGTDDLDAARRVLLDRLSRHSNDFAATTALQALDTYSAEQHADTASDAPAIVRTAGLSGVDRMRRSRVRSVV
jgi:hypothetical protein